MRKSKHTIFIILVLIGHILIAQDIDIEIPDSLFILEEEMTDEIIDPIEQQPIYHGGQDSLWCFLETHFDKRRISQYDSSRLILIQFIINENGAIQDLEVNPDQITEKATHLNFVKDPRIIEEISESFKKLSQWEPATLGGIKVKSRMIQMIRFPYKFKCKTK
jgi:hypothetical protein